MESPLQITFRDFEHTPDLDQLIRKRSLDLEKAAGHRLTSCHVVVELGAMHPQRPRAFHVRIDLSLPGGVIAVNRKPQDEHPHEDAHVAVRDAFDVAHREIEDWERKHHGSA